MLRRQELIGLKKAKDEQMGTQPTRGFKPGVSGNPKGRPRGIKTDNARLREAIAGSMPEVIGKLVELAIAGDTTAAGLLLARVLPACKPQELPQAFALPDGTLSEQARALMASIASGELGIDAGAKLLAGMGTMAKIIETDELQRRIEVLEASNEAKR